MPQVAVALLKVGFFVFEAFAGAAAAATLGAGAAVAIGAAVVVGGTLVAKRMMSLFEVEIPTVDSDASRQRTVRSTIEPQKIVYGEALVSGPISFIGLAGTDNSDLYQTIVLAGHEVTDITNIHMDDVVITDAQINNGSTAGGNVTGGTFGPKGSTTICTINKYLGLTSQTADSLLTNAFTNYTSAHRGDGIAYLSMKWVLNDDSAETWDKFAPSNVKALVKGKPVYDPRLDTGAPNYNPLNQLFITYNATAGSYVGQGQNPALVLADYLISDLGMGISPSKIEWSSFITAANGCDVSVNVPNSQTEKRFTCNGVLFATDSHQKNINKILSSMNGNLVYSNGKYIVHAGIYEDETVANPFGTLNENDLIGAISVTTSLERSDRFNTIKGLFIDPNQNHKSSEFPKVQLANAVTRDNDEVLEKEVQYPMTNSSYMAQRLSFKLIKLSDQQKIISFPANLSALRITAGDRVKVSIEELSWSDKIFQCVGWNFSEEGGVNLTLREDSSSAYADPVPNANPALSEYSTVTATGDITDAFRGVPSPSGLRAASGEKKVFLNWVNPGKPSDFGTIEIYASASNNIANAVKIGETDGTQFVHDGNNAADQIAVDDTRVYWVRSKKNVGTVAEDAVSVYQPDSTTGVGPVTVLATLVDWGNVADPTIGIDLNANDTISINLGSSTGTSGELVTKSGIEQEVEIAQGGITMNQGGSIKGGQSAYNSGTGFFLGYDTNAYKFSIGNASNEALTFDGTNLAVTGAITATSGTFTGTVNASAGEFTGSVSIGSTGAIYGGTMNEFLKANTSGFFLGYDTNAYKLSVGDANGEVLTWDGTKLNVDANTVSFSTGGEQDYSSESRYTTSQKSATVVLANNSSYFLFDNRRQDLAFPDFIVSYYLGPLTSGTQSSQTNARNGIMDSIKVELFYADASTGSPGTWTSFRSITAGSWYTNTGLGAMFSNFRVKDSGAYVASLDTRNGILDDYPTIAPFGNDLDGTSVPVGLVDNDYFINIPISKNTFVFPKGRYFIKAVITVTNGSLSPYPATGSPTATERRVSIPNASSFVHPDFGQSVFVGGAHTTIFTDNDRDNETLIKGGSVYLMSKEGANADDQDSTAIFFGGRGTTGGTPNAAYGPLHGLYFFNDRDSIGSGSGILGSIGSPQFSMYVPYDGSKLTFGGDVNFTDGLYINGVAVNAGAVTGPAGSDTQVQFNNSGSLGASSAFTFNDATDTLAVTNLTVSGTTTSVNVADLNVVDKDITLNYATGDSSSSANNAGIIIQDAVSATADASLLWKTASDTFEFSHGVVTPTLVSGDIDIGDGTAREELKIKSNSYAEIHYFIKSSQNSNVLTEYIRAGVALTESTYNQTIGDYFLYSPQSGKMLLTVPQNGDPLSRNNGAITIIDSTNYGTYALPLSGGTLTGALSGTAGTFTGAVSGASFELSGISVIDSNQNINAASISTDAITSSGDITLTSTATSSPSVNFNSSTATDPAVDMAIKLVGEDLHFYEPEDSNKVHFKILDDTGVDAPFGYWVNGTRMADASRNLTVGTIGSGAITSTGGLSGTTGTFSGVVYAGTRVEINGGAAWAYTRLKDSGGTKWDIAANANDNSSALQFRPFGSGTNATLMSTGGNWTIAGTVSSGAITSSGVITAAGLVSSTTGSSYSSGTVAAIFKDTTERGTVRIRSDADKAAELFFDVNDSIAWDISARNSVGSYDLQFFGRATTPSLTAVGGPFFTITQAGFADALAGFKVNGSTVIDSSRNLTAANGNFSGIVGVNKATNSAVGLSVGSDASTTASYGLEVCNSSSNTRFIVDGVGNSTFYQSDNSVGMTVTSGGNVDINSGVLKMGGTTVISSGRNLANIGSYTGVGQILVTGQNIPIKAVGTSASGYTEVQIVNDNGAQLVMGSIGSTYSPAAFAGSRYIYSTSGDFRIKSAGALKLYSGGVGDTDDLAVTFDTSRNATFTGTITSNGAAYIGGNLFFGVTGTSSFIGRESTVNLGLYADGAHKFYTYTNAWTEQATINDSGLTVFGQITVTNDDHNYLKIEADIAKEQMVRFKNSSSNYWYAGLRTSNGLATTVDFHIYSAAYANDVFALKTDGSMVVAKGATFNAETYVRDASNVGIRMQTTDLGTGSSDGLRVGINGTEAFVWNFEALPLTLATSGVARFQISSGGAANFYTNSITSGDLLSSGYLKAGSTASNRFGGDTYSGAVGMYDNSSFGYQTPVLVIRKDATQTGALNTAPVSLFIHNGVGKWVKLSLGARETNTAGNTVSIAGIASERTAGTLNAWATGNLHLWTKSAGNQITNMVLKSDGDTEIPSGDLYVNGSILGKGIRSANRGEFHLNAPASGDVAEIFFGHGSGYTEANIRWGISDRGSTGGEAGLLHFYKGPAFGNFVAVATLNANTSTFSVLNGYKVNDVTVIDSSRNITAVNVQATGGINLRRNTGAATGLSFYNTTYHNWQVYMSPAGTTGCGPNANLTAPYGLAGVTSWALRSRMEGVATYGWIWETGASGSGSATATAKMSLQSTTGNLQIAGSFTAGANITAYSDERLKDNIKTLDGSKVLEMRGVSFTKDGKAGSGVIAQEIERIAPELVEDDGTYKSVAYGNLVGYLIENAKQQQSEIDELKALVKKLMEK